MSVHAMGSEQIEHEIERVWALAVQGEAVGRGASGRNETWLRMLLRRRCVLRGMKGARKDEAVERQLVDMRLQRQAYTRAASALHEQTIRRVNRRLNDVEKTWQQRMDEMALADVLSAMGDDLQALARQRPDTPMDTQLRMRAVRSVYLHELATKKLAEALTSTAAGRTMAS